MPTSNDAAAHRGSVNPQSVNLTIDAIPEVKMQQSIGNSNTGESTNNALSSKSPHHQTGEEIASPASWYALRMAYANETNIKNVYERIMSDEQVKLDGFFPTLVRYKKDQGKVIKEEICRLKNIFFLRGTFDQVKHFVYDNHRFKHLRFYSRHYHDNRKDEPIVIPDSQIESLRIICESNSQDVIVIEDSVNKFERGQRVLIKDGDFAGVTGVVARFAGHQRVGIVIGGSLTIATAYIPSAFLETI